MVTDIYTNYCVYLGFAVNKELYMKSCKRCHFLMRNYCTKLAETRIIEMHKSSKQLNVKTSINQHAITEIQDQET